MTITHTILTLQFAILHDPLPTLFSILSQPVNPPVNNSNEFTAGVTARQTSALRNGIPASLVCSGKALDGNHERVGIVCWISRYGARESRPWLLWSGLRDERFLWRFRLRGVVEWHFACLLFSFSLIFRFFWSEAE